MNIVHIINPVKVSSKSDLFIAQPVTFETMRRAREFAKAEVEVNLVTTQYPEDREIIPEYFSMTADLERSVLDMGSFQKSRKLPLIKDLLDRAIEFDTTADYIIYTNSDIAVMPHFYLFVHQKIKEGLDAFVINRRTVRKDHTLEDLSTAYSDYGKKHPGFDCFIFRRDAALQFNLGLVCIGTTRIGLALISNLIMRSSSFRIFDEEHLTFHLGEDRVWTNTEFSDYVEHNEKEVIEVLNELRDFDTAKFDGDELIQKYYKALMRKETTDSPNNSAKKKTSLYNRIFNKKA